MEPDSPLPWPGEPPLGGVYSELEVEAAVDAIRRSMDWRIGFRAANEVEAFEAEFAKYIGATYAVAVNGAGTGLDIAMMALDLEPGDEVISCAINFPGTHLAILGQGARLVLAEPDPGTLNLDPIDLERCLSPRTRGVVVTHMNGLSADMDAISEVIERRKTPRRGPIRVIGDGARALGAAYKGRRVGQDGWLTVFSFQSKKTMTTLGEGGMLVTNDRAAADRARRIRSFGDGAAWGTNYKLSKAQAAVGPIQLRNVDALNDRRRLGAAIRNRLLANSDQLSLPTEPEDFRHVYYLYSVRIREGGRRRRDRLLANLRDDYGIGAVVGNPPTYSKNPWIKRAVGQVSLPVAELVGETLLCPSMHPSMTTRDHEYVAGALMELLERH
jgi:dTDP-4-amino-4,6-dideoxygalactose transaminase